MARCELHDAMPQPNVPRSLAGGPQENLGRRRVGVLLQKVMLDLPGIVVTQTVGQFELVECVVVQMPLAVRAPRPWQLQLIKDAEFHPPASCEICHSLTCGSCFPRPCPESVVPG